MTNRQAAGAVLATLLLPAALLAQNPPKFVGDDGANTPGYSRNVLGGSGTGVSAAGSAMNLSSANRPSGQFQNRRAFTYERYRRQNGPNSPLVQPLVKERVTITRTSGTAPPQILPTAQEWLEFIRDRVPDPNDVDYDGRPDSQQNPRPTGLSVQPPRQTILVVDQGWRKKQIDAGRPPEVVTYKTQTIINRWTTADPVYENHTVVGYPCCCNITFSLLVGYRYTEHVQTEYRQVPEADYKTTEIAVDRGIIVNAGNPQYTTQIPRLCEFHYGPGAVFTAPVVPLIADINDRPAGGSTSTTGGTSSATFNTLITSQNSTYVQDLNYNTVATNSTSTVSTNYSQTTIIPVGTRPLVAGTAPSGTNYGGFTMQPGTYAQTVNLPADDRGVQQNSGDKAYVVNATTADGLPNAAPPGDKDAPFQFHLK